MSLTIPFRVFLVDDHPLLRTGLRFTLDEMTDLDLIGEAADGFEGVEKILQNPPDIALIDIDLPGISGITVIGMLRNKLPGLKIIALSSYSEKGYVTGAMQAGADGYLLKAISITALVDFLREFAQGKQPVSPYLLDLAVAHKNALENEEDVHISPREKQVLKLLAEGKSNKQIADEIFLSIETVKTHIKNIFQKLEVKSRMEAVIVGRRRKLID